jgi:hypothetical protein
MYTRHISVIFRLLERPKLAPSRTLKINLIAPIDIKLLKKAFLLAKVNHSLVWTAYT